MKIILFIVSLIYFSAISTGHAAQNVPSKLVLCITCHGKTGMSISPEWPNLAAQHSTYLIKQLYDYKNITERNVPIMSAMVASLTDEEITLLADFYSRQRLKNNKITSQNLNRGEQLYRRGDLSKKITACIACHGPKGEGNKEAKFPLLTAQHSKYTILQLQAFKNKKRTNDLNGIMRDITSHMDDNDMLAVAEYIQNLEPEK